LQGFQADARTRTGDPFITRLRLLMSEIGYLQGLSNRVSALPARQCRIHAVIRAPLWTVPIPEAVDGHIRSLPRWNRRMPLERAGPAIVAQIHHNLNTVADRRATALGVVRASRLPFHGCRSGTGPDRVRADAWISSRAGANSTCAETFAIVVEAAAGRLGDAAHV
jgi:hypothetical protein